MKKKAVYAGSFDPITIGHVWMIEQGARLFDDLVVAIGTNPDKKYTFSVDERLEMIRDAIRALPNVTVDHFENTYLVQFARGVGATYILRGIRTEADYAYERAMRYVNSDLNPDVVSVFLIPPREIAEISSSFVRGLVGPAGWEAVVKRYVPEAVYRRFVEKLTR